MGRSFPMAMLMIVAIFLMAFLMTSSEGAGRDGPMMTMKAMRMMMTEKEAHDAVARLYNPNAGKFSKGFGLNFPCIKQGGGFGGEGGAFGGEGGKGDDEYGKGGGESGEGEGGYGKGEGNQGKGDENGSEGGYGEGAVPMKEYGNVAAGKSEKGKARGDHGKVAVAAP